MPIAWAWSISETSHWVGFTGLSSINAVCQVNASVWYELKKIRAHRRCFVHARLGVYRRPSIPIHPQKKETPEAAKTATSGAQREKV